jgi:hypothetical protein
MLKAVLARELAKHMQSGLSNEEALQRFDEHIKKVAARMPAPG